MPVQPIILYPNSLLRAVAVPLDFNDPAAGTVVRDLWDTLDAHIGVGLAAPQIGQGLRAIAVDCTRAKRPIPNHGRVCLLNPEIALAEGECAFREGCMSIPDLVARVPRSARVTVAGLTPEGQKAVLECEGFEAVVFQHEIDHLNGVLFIDRVRSARDIQSRSL